MQHVEGVQTRRGAMFYFSIAIAIVFLGGMAALMFAIGYKEGSWGMVVFGVGILVVTWYLVRGYYRNAPKVWVTQSGFTWRSHHYGWDEVSSIKLTGSQPMRMIGGKDMEGTAIVLKTGDKLILLDGMFSNLGAVRRFIAEVAPAELGTRVQPERAGTTRAAVRSAGYGPAAVVPEEAGIQYVRGNSILNMYRVFTWVFAIGAVIGAVAANIAGITVFLIMFAGGFGALFTMFLNYFGVSADAIIVRNVYRPWKRKVYPLSDIQQVIFASNHNGSNVMRLVFNDYGFKEIVAAGLRGSDWLALLQVLRSRGVEVKDENDFEMWAKPEMKKRQRYMVWYLILYFIVSLAVFLWITSLHVSENALIGLKLGWIVFMIVALIGVMKLVVRMGKKDVPGEEDNSTGTATP